MFRKAGTFPCTAAGAPSCPRQSLSEPCPVSLIPNLIGFQGDMTGVSPGARITCSVLLIASLPCIAEAAGHSSVPLSSPGRFHSQPVPCPSTDPRIKQLLQMLEGLDTVFKILPALGVTAVEKALRESALDLEDLARS